MSWMRRTMGVLIGWRLFGPAFRPMFDPGQEHPWRVPGRSLFVGDREFFVRQVGSGPDVVLIHGLAGSSLAEWYRIGPLLQDSYRLTLIDHRNHGMAAKSLDRFEIEDVADDVAAVMDAIGVTRAHVVGYSMGGAIAQALARRHRHRVGRLVLIATFSKHPDTGRTGRTLGVWMIRAFERLTGVGTPEVRYSYLVKTGAVERRHARWMWDETHRRDPEAGPQASLATFRFDSSDWVGSLVHPTLVIIPTNDMLVPPAWQYALAAAIQNAVVLEVADAGHEVPWTHPQELVKGVIEFLADGV